MTMFWQGKHRIVYWENHSDNLLRSKHLFNFDITILSTHVHSKSSQLPDIEGSHLIEELSVYYVIWNLKLEHEPRDSDNTFLIIWKFKEMNFVGISPLCIRYNILI